MTGFRTTDKIIFASLFVIAATLIYVVFSINTIARQAASAASQGATTSDASSSSTEITIPPTALTPVGGVVASVQGNSITLSGSPASGGASQTIQVPSTATIVSEGAKKDAATYANEMQAFMGTLHQLEQDPQRNAQALSTLVAPSPYVETTISLSDVKAGDFVTAFIYGETVVRLNVMHSQPQS